MCNSKSLVDCSMHIYRLELLIIVTCDSASTKRITQGDAANGRKTQPPEKVDHLSLLEKKQPPIHVVNRQTKKISPLEPARAITNSPTSSYKYYIMIGETEL